MSPIVRQFAVTLLVSSALVALINCKAKPGGKCALGQGSCADAKDALSCGPDLKLVAVSCKGPAGCVMERSTNRVNCDDSVADEGDACLLSHAENFACSSDHKKSLKCDGGTFKVHENCRGPKACKIKHDWATSSDEVACDIHLQQKGDPCMKPGNFACSVDYKQMLQCKDGIFDTYRYCRGATACSLRKETEVNCDESVAELNDPCGVPGMLACASDGKNELSCQGGKFTKARECKRLGCHLTAANHIDCQ